MPLEAQPQPVSRRSYGETTGATEKTSLVAAASNQESKPTSSSTLPSRSTRAPFGSVGETDQPRALSQTPRLDSFAQEPETMGVLRLDGPGDRADGAASLIEARRRARRRALARQRRALAEAEAAREPEVRPSSHQVLDVPSKPLVPRLEQGVLVFFVTPSPRLLAVAPELM